ncbi:hypothetical protein RRG08_024476 [Elysia crispata]|uniref:Uncharacterized protein n=1 Tax=Elysia crispata TaxID=231223 RepID=A0AAE0YQ20_9GAST|nr:hypothetical protein RRG08_024476 [Elysia crispata]
MMSDVITFCRIISPPVQRAVGEAEQSKSVASTSVAQSTECPTPGADQTLLMAVHWLSWPFSSAWNVDHRLLPLAQATGGLRLTSRWHHDLRRLVQAEER